jgi:Ca2+-binding RTX toxin-like protein
LSGSEDAALIIPVTVLLANDRDSDGDALAIVAVDGAVNGTVQLSGRNVIFTPALNHHGLASFSYTVADAHGATGMAGVELTISAVNDPPAGADATITTAEDTAFSLTAADFGFSDPNDSPADSLAAVTITSLPTDGVLLLNGVAVSAGQSIGAADIGAGALVFEPAPNAGGAAYARFTFQIQDSGGTANGGQDIDPSPNSVTIDVTPVNDPPVAGDDAFSTDEDVALSGSVLANDSDVEGPLAVSLAAGPVNGSLSLNVDGTFTYTPAADFNGADGFTYVVTDSDGAIASATVIIEVIPVNDLPNATDDMFSTDEDIALNGSVLGNDSDVEGPLAVSLAAGPANGSLALNFDGIFTYTPTADFNGTDAFSYIVTDSDGAIASATVTIDVIPVNDPPIVGNEIWAVSSASALSLDTSTLLANDADPEGSPLAVTGVGNASNGTVGLAGTTVTYTAGAPGPARFEYTVADSGGASSTGIVSVTNVQVTAGADTIDISGLGASHSLIDGGNGNDAITGGAGIDQLIGGAGSDTLAGGAGIDSLSGGAGNDTLDGGTGADALTGGTGNDTYVVDDVGDSLFEAPGAGTDLVRSPLTWTLGADVENLTLIGSGAIDGTGNALANVITGNGADNRLDGGSGNDTLNGGAGNDTLDGGPGNDRLLGGAGDDVYLVDSTSDLITENAGEGTDLVLSSVTRTLGSNVENLTLTGGASINGTGNALDNILVGNTGDNTLDGGVGADTMAGGAGNDNYVVDDAGDIVLEAAGEGTDLVQSAVTAALAANVENLTLTGSAAINGTGNDLANVVLGNSGANALDGGLGNDTLDGGAGNDTLDGGTGADVLTGGAGNDTYLVDDIGDTVLEAAGAGTDLIQSSLTWTLGADVENLTLLGSGAIDGTGNTLANVITGNGADNRLEGGAGNDTLNGGAGNDTLDGGAGNDSLFGGPGDDVFVVDSAADATTENANEGTDTLLSSVTRTLGNNFENLTLTGGASINGTGNALDNILVGNTGNNTLNGLAGADTMAGGAGNETYVVDNVGDIILEAVGEGTDLAQSSVNITLAANVENLTLTGSAAINGAGNDLDNVVLGNTGANTLDGGAGNDTLDGGSGNDIILGGFGDDVIDGASGGGNDTITGGPGADTINVTSGNDRIVHLSTGDVFDTIIGFDNNPSGGQDFVDLDTLFDSLGAAGGGRAGRVQFVDTGPDVQVNIDADAAAGNGFELTLLTFQGMANLTGLTVGTAATDDIQVGG